MDWGNLFNTIGKVVVSAYTMVGGGVGMAAAGANSTIQMTVNILGVVGGAFLGIGAVLTHSDNVALSNSLPPEIASVKPGK
jgi:hypothetical protein